MTNTITSTRSSRRFTWTKKGETTPYVCLINADTYTEAIAILETVLKSEYGLEIDEIEITRCETLN